MKKVELCLITFGVIIGIIGVLHGCAELLQGSALVGSQSTAAMPEGWPNSEFHTLMKGSPVFTLLTGIPFFALGLLAISVSITMIVCSLTVVRLNRFGLAVFALLSAGIFLFGAGRGTPVAVSMPVLVFGVASLAMPGTKTRSSAAIRRLRFWFNAFYWLHIFSWVLFFPGLFILSFYGEIPTALFIFDFAAMPVSVLGALISGFMLDRSYSASTP
ncbi:MAG: hypothetical protein ACE366_14310 [Bradymonadia bacterium]